VSPILFPANRSTSTGSDPVDFPTSLPRSGDGHDDGADKSGAVRLGAAADSDDEQDMEEPALSRAQWHPPFYPLSTPFNNEPSSPLDVFSGTGLWSPEDEKCDVRQLP
jgi:hypothetical protein